MQRCLDRASKKLAPTFRMILIGIGFSLIQSCAVARHEEAISQDKATELALSIQDAENQGGAIELKYGYSNSYQLLLYRHASGQYPCNAFSNPSPLPDSAANIEAWMLAVLGSKHWKSESVGADPAVSFSVLIYPGLVPSHRTATDACDGFHGDDGVEIAQHETVSVEYQRRSDVEFNPIESADGLPTASPLVCQITYATLPNGRTRSTGYLSVAEEAYLSTAADESRLFDRWLENCLLQAFGAPNSKTLREHGVVASDFQAVRETYLRNRRNYPPR